MIHLKVIWDNNGSRRNTRLIRKYVEGEKQLKRTKELLEELSEDKQSSYWWVN